MRTGLKLEYNHQQLCHYYSTRTFNHNSLNCQVEGPQIMRLSWTWKLSRRIFKSCIQDGCQQILGLPEPSSYWKYYKRPTEIILPIFWQSNQILPKHTWQPTQQIKNFKEVAHTPNEGSSTMQMVIENLCQSILLKILSIE